MDMERMRQAKLREIEEESRQRAVKEIMDLKARHSSTGNLAYTFEYQGQEIQSAFVTASLQQECANSYQIEVLVPPNMVVNGQAYIRDLKGKKLGAGATTKKGAKENRVILETLAV